VIPTSMSYAKSVIANSVLLWSGRRPYSALSASAVDVRAAILPGMVATMFAK